MAVRRMNRSISQTYARLIWMAPLLALPSALAQPPALAPRGLSPGDIHTQSSRVYVRVGKVGLGHDHAVEGQIQSGRLLLGAEQDAGQIVFDMASFAADTDHARQVIGLSGTTSVGTQQQVNANMRGAAVLDVDGFPTASLRVTAMRPTGTQSARHIPQYQIDGEFHLHGVVRPIRILAEVEELPGWFHVRGGFVLQQTHYGIQPFSKAFGAIGVTDRLDIWGDLYVVRTASLAAGSATLSH